jgi:hypothetical protein
MKIDRVTDATIRELWSGIEPRVRHATTLEEGAQALATELHTQFAESVVLARVFLTVRFDGLPADVRAFVENLARSAGKTSHPLPGLMPVLSLVGTQGQETGWNARRSSRGHQGIPLMSAAFVGAIPMIARLFREIGVPLTWIDSDDAQRIATAVGHSAGLFFVPDAESAVDDHGRKIIAAQDFVSAHGVRTVFGTSAAYARGQLLVIVVFCRDQVARATAERFLALADLFKGQTASLLESGKVFAAA